MHSELDNFRSTLLFIVVTFSQNHGIDFMLFVLSEFDRVHQTIAELITCSQIIKAITLENDAAFTTDSKYWSSTFVSDGNDILQDANT